VSGFDMSLVQRGARLRRSPYHEATQRCGPGGFTVYNHMLFPIRFDTFAAEFDALLTGVTLWDVAVERCLEISGPDGFTFAQLLTPRDLSRCAVHVESEWGPRTATVVPKPFVDPDKRIPVS
jgi:glycine cleavage system aminomethyltransferase T